MKQNHWIFICLLFLVTACATGHQKTSTQLRQMVTERKIESGIKILDESDLAKDTNSRLLYLIEKGLLYHYENNYLASVTAFSEARDLLDELYTTRISGKIKSTLNNDNSDIYYGEKYEASLVHFYLALNYFRLSNKENDVTKSKEYLRQARAEILGWDTFLTTIKNERLGSAIFKEDLLAKTFGAFVHESLGTSNDKQIALQLYEDAYEVLFKNYNLYPTFNSAYELFKDNYSSLPSLSRSEIEKKYVKPTNHYQAISQFLTTKILILTKALRPNQLKEKIAKLRPSDDILKRLNVKTGQVTFLVQDGLIVEKKAKKFNFPINLGVQTGFASTLGVGSSISFELPTVENVPAQEGARLEALDQNGKLISKTNLSVVAPVSEMAQQAINEHSTSIAAKTGARLVTKHLAAIAAAYATYQGMKEKNEAMAKFMATLGHASAVAAINASEKADTRFWSTLPSNVRMGHMFLPAGTYKFRAVFGNEGTTNHHVIDLGDQKIEVGQLGFVTNN